MSRTTPHGFPNSDAFPTRHFAGNRNRMSALEFADAILGRRNPGESSEFAEMLLREFDPDQPRDEQGRWTSDGSGDGATAKKISKVKRERKEP